jgi:hypothetical protein
MFSASYFPLILFIASPLSFSSLFFSPSGLPLKNFQGHPVAPSRKYGTALSTWQLRVVMPGSPGNTFRDPAA